MEAGTANGIADQKQIAKWMVSASLSVQNTKLHMQHPITAFFTMNLLFRHRECMNKLKKRVELIKNMVLITMWNL